MLSRRAIIPPLLPLILCCNVASASIALKGLTLGTSFVGHDNTGETSGWSSKVMSPLDVMSLGVFDESADGRTNTRDVGIWDRNVTLIASTTAPNGTETVLDNSFRFASINSGSFTVGELFYVGASYSPPSDPDSVLIDVPTWMTVPEMIYDSRQVGDYSASLSVSLLAARGFNDYFGAKGSRQGSLITSLASGTRRPNRMQPPFKGLNISLQKKVFL